MHNYPLPLSHCLHTSFKVFLWSLTAFRKKFQSMGISGWLAWLLTSLFSFYIPYYSCGFSCLILLHMHASLMLNSSALLHLVPYWKGLLGFYITESFWSLQSRLLPIHPLREPHISGNPTSFKSCTIISIYLIHVASYFLLSVFTHQISSSGYEKNLKNSVPQLVEWW